MLMEPVFVTLFFTVVACVELRQNDRTFLKAEQTSGQHLKQEHHLYKQHTWHQEVRKFEMYEGHDAFDKHNDNANPTSQTEPAFLTTNSHRDNDQMRFKGGYPNYHESFSETSQSLIKKLCNINGKKKVCYTHGRSVCTCQGQLADCSGKPYVANIGYAPKFPKEMGIKCLIFHHNNARYLDESYFANVSDFRVIDFSNNNLQTVSHKTFSRFNGNLVYLILNFNLISYSNIANILKFPPSQRLDLVHAGISSSIPKDFFRPFADMTMSELYLDLNFIQKLDLHEFSALKNLRFLSLKNCSINELKSDVMPTMEFLNIENNPITDFPTTCRSQSIDILSSSDSTQQLATNSMFPKLKGLTMGNTKITTFPLQTELCLPKLELLFMFLSNISTFRSNSLRSLTSLSVLILDRMKSNVSNIEANAFSSESLLTLHLTKNHIQFGSEHISDFMIQDCPSLEVLHLDHNNFLNASEKSFSNLLANLSRLTNLYLGSSQVTFIPSKAMAHLTKLNRLYLYLNEITTIPPAAFDTLSSLEYLFLDENKINTVQSQSFSTQTIQRLKEIDMNRNNFQCNCDLLWFQSWIIQDGPQKFYDYPKGYTCSDRPGTMVSEFILSKQACLYSRKTYILFTVCLSILIVSIVVFSIVFRYRWHIRLALHEWRSSRPTQHQEHPDATHDVFIVYCNDDSEWVVDELLPRVENDWGLNAFIHERDFVAGHWIIDNTVMAMNSCRHVLVVLSTRFAASQWCNMELMLCQSHVIEHDLPSLLVVQLEPMAPREMSPVVAALRSTTTFLEWPEDPGRDDLFWRKLERCVRRMARSPQTRRTPGDDRCDIRLIA